MYKDVVRRAVASILVFCMIGSTPDVTLLAKEADGTAEQAAAASHVYDYNTGEDASALQSVPEGSYIANAYTVEANNDTEMNAQKLTNVAFALDYMNKGGDSASSIEKADYEISIYKGRASANGLTLLSGTPQATVSGTYTSGKCAQDHYFDVPLEEKKQVLLGTGEKFAVKVTLTNAYLLKDGDDASQPTSTVFYESVSNTSAESYANGTALSGRAALIRATTEEVTQEIPVTGLSIPVSSQMKVGESAAVSLTYTPATTSQKEVIWSSDEPSVAEVSQDGTVTARKRGETTIRVTSVADESVTAEMQLEVCEDIADADVTAIADQTYQGTDLEPTFEVRNAAGELLTKNTEYKVVYSDNRNVGTATAKITSNGNGYLGEKELTFKIVPARMDLSVAAEWTGTAYTYTGSEITLSDPAAELSLKYTNSQGTKIPLTYSADGKTGDYVIDSYSNNKQTGNRACVTLKGINNYTGTINCYFQIRKDYTESDLKVEFNPSYAIYDATDKTPDVTVTCDGQTLEENSDYTVAYDTDMTSAGNKTITITGQGIYAGITKTVTWEIRTKNLTEAMVTLPNQVDTVDKDSLEGLVVKAAGKELVRDTDYTVDSVVVDKSAMTATVTIKGIGNYGSTVTKTVNVGTDIKGCDVTIAEAVYTGKAVTPEITITKDGVTVDPENYSLTWKNNINAADKSASVAPTVTITGKGTYAGQRTETFTISKKDLATLESGTPAGTLAYEEEVPYNKKEAATGITTEVKAVYNGMTLQEGSDYTIAYTGNTAGVTNTASFTLTAGADSNYTGSITKIYGITQTDIETLTFEPETVEPQEYLGQAIKPEIKILQDGVELEKDTDYSITYDSNNGIGTGHIVIKGKDNYGGMKDIPFEIRAVGLEKADITLDAATAPYTGSEIKPGVTVTLTANGSTITLAENTDYTVSYENNIEAGTATVTVTGVDGKYTGSKAAEFTITKPLTHNATVLVGTIADQVYQGKNVEPGVIVIDQYTDGSTKHLLQENKEYTLSYKDNGKVGTATVTIQGKGCYTDSVKKTFTITQGSLRSDSVTAELKSSSDTVRRFTGSPVTPEIVVTCNGNTLKEGTDYTLTYYKNTNVADASYAAIEGGDGLNFYGLKTLSFEIVARSITSDGIQVQIAEIDAAELAKKGAPDVTVKDTARYSNGRNKIAETGAGSGDYTLVSGKDYTVGKAVVGTDGTAQVDIIGTGNYDGKLTEKFPVKQTEIEPTDDTISVSLPDDQKSFVYTGKEIIPQPVVTMKQDGRGVELEEGKDYTVSSGYTDVGSEYHYKVTFMGQYRGVIESSDTFAITPKNISDADVTVDPIPNQSANGTQICPDVTVRYNGEVVAKSNYILTYGGNLEATGSVTITGAVNFTGSRIELFTIGKDITSGLQVSGLDKTFVYTSKEIRPDVTVKRGNDTLVEGRDYVLSYRNNINAKSAMNTFSAYVIVTGAGQYGGSAEFPFTISQKNMQDSDIKLAIKNAEFTGSPIVPEVEITYNLPDGSVYVLKDKHAADAAGTYRDYDINVAATENVGDNVAVTIVPSGINFYCDGGSFSPNEKLTIVAKKLVDEESNLRSDYTVSPIADIQFKASEVPYEPDVVLRDRTRDESTGAHQEAGSVCYQLVKDKDYTITYSGNTRPGEATYTITGKGNYQGTFTGHFNIMASISDAVITVEDQTYTGDRIEPSFTVAFGSDMILRNGVDYTYEFKNNLNAGTASLEIIGKGSYAGSSQTVNFKILPKDIGADDVQMTHVYESYSYTGEDIYPDPHFTYNNKKLSSGTDFTCAYEPSCSTAGKWYNFTVTGVGNFTGTLTRAYKIGDNYNKDRIKVELADGYSFEYTGSPILPTPKVTRLDSGHVGELLQPNIDYKYEYEDNLDAGTASVNTWGIPDDFAGDVSVTFEITPKSIADADVSVAAVSDYDYTGEAITPEPDVFWDGKQLIAGEDFEYVYSNNTDAGTATVSIKGKKNFTDSQDITFTIHQKDISGTASGVKVEDIPEQIYTGKEAKPQPVLTWGDKTLDPRTDYTVTYENNTEIGTATATIEGTGNYTGTVTKTFRIIKVPVADMKIDYEKNWYYTGNPIEPEVKISYVDSNGNSIQLDSDLFDIQYKNTVDCGNETGTITISGDEHYEGRQICYYTIQKRPLSDATITIDKVQSQVIDGVTGKAEPKPTLTFRPDSKTTYTMIEGTDYELSYMNNTKAGQNGTVTITGTGNFTGTATQTFYIGEDIKQYVDSIEFTDTFHYVYNGKAQTPDVTVVMKSSADLVEGRDYEILYDGQKKDDITDDAYATKAGTHKVSISGLAPYGGTMEKTYTIDPKELSLVDFEIDEQIYTGGNIHPVIIGTDEDANTRLGQDETEGSVSGELEKDDMYINRNVFTAEYPLNCSDVGTVNVTLTAKEGTNYTGTATATFNIVPKNIQDESIEPSVIEQQYYNGKEIRPEFTLTDMRRNAEGGVYESGVDKNFYVLREGTDYDLTYIENIYPGTAIMTVTGKNHYTGTLTKQFAIVADLADAVISEIPPQKYTGQPVTPEITVTLGERTLIENFDFTVSYSDNVDRGTATVTISPVAGSMYTGSNSTTFDISRELTDGTASITLIDTSFVYTGSEIRPAAAVMYGDRTLTEGTDYAISYVNNVNAGTATIQVTGIGAFTGTLTTQFTILRRNIIRCSFSTPENKTYDEQPTTQNITVIDGSRVLVLNQDYQIAYINNAKPGTATMTITGIGNYGGIKTIRYVIHVADMSQVSAAASANSVKLSWDAVTGAEGYAIYNADNDLIAKTRQTAYTIKKLKSMKIYTYKVRPYVVSDGATYYGEFSNTLTVVTTPAKTTVKTVSANSSVKLTWKKIKRVSGYVVYRATSKKGKYKKIKTLKKASKTTYTNKNLKAGKTYYYKIRAYRKVNGKKVYGSYSKVKAVRVR